MLGVLFGAAAFTLPPQTAEAALQVQGCVKLDGRLTQGVRVEAFDVRTCTAIQGATTDANGDFVIYNAVGDNQYVYLQYTAPDGCIEIVDNPTVCNNVITDPQDGRFGWIALCIDMKCACVPCPTGVAKVVLQYLGTSEQIVGAWATTTGSKNGSKAGSKGSKGKSGGSKKTSSKPSSKPAPAPATPLFCAPVKPCTTFTISAPITPPTSGSKNKVGSKNKSGSKSGKVGSKGGSKNKGSKNRLSGLTLFVGNNVNTRIDLRNVTNGQIIGMFRVIRIENSLGQRICPAPKNPNCTTAGKPNQITLKYVGGNCSTAVNSQTRGTSYNCADAGSAAPGPVRIVISSSANPTLKGFFSGIVCPGQTFVVRSGSKYKPGTFGNATYAYVYSCGRLIECIQIDTSCSAPLIPGETFGALKLVNYAIVK